MLLTLAALTHARSRIDDSTLTAAVSSRDHSAHVTAAWAGLGIALSAGALQLGTYELALELLAEDGGCRGAAWSASPSSRPCSCPAAPGGWRVDCPA